MRDSRRGLALGLVVVTAVVFAIMAYAALVMALQRVRMAPVTVQQLRARYAAEGGLAWAMQRLWDNPRWFSPEGWTDPGPPNDPPVDLTNGMKVDLIMPACQRTPCESRRLQARIVY